MNHTVAKVGANVASANEKEGADRILKETPGYQRREIGNSTTAGMVDDLLYGWHYSLKSMYLSNRVITNIEAFISGYHRHKALKNIHCSQELRLYVLHKRTNSCSKLNKVRHHCPALGTRTLSLITKMSASPASRFSHYAYKANKMPSTSSQAQVNK